MLFALEKFHQYTFGRSTLVETDHKPLDMIVTKPLYKTPKRLQSILLRLAQYDIKVTYKPGKELFIADTLSRAYLDEHYPDKHSQVNAVGHLKIGADKLQELREETKSDDTMSILKEVILQGWPVNKSKVPVQVAPYFTFRDELTVHDGLVFKGERVVVPVSLRQNFKERLHSSHLGSESMLRRARECIYWPGMSADIRNITDSCDACQTFGRAQQKESLRAHDAEAPWKKVAVDLFTSNGRTYLITVDY